MSTMPTCLCLQHAGSRAASISLADSEQQRIPDLTREDSEHEDIPAEFPHENVSLSIEGSLAISEEALILENSPSAIPDEPLVSKDSSIDIPEAAHLMGNSSHASPDSEALMLEDRSTESPQKELMPEDSSLKCSQLQLLEDNCRAALQEEAKAVQVSELAECPRTPSICSILAEVSKPEKTSRSPGNQRMLCRA